MAVNLYPRYLWAVLHATFITISLMRPHLTRFSRQINFAQNAPIWIVYDEHMTFA